MLLKMTTTDSAEEKLLKASNFEQEEEQEEEEALSLSDLPLNLINEDDDHHQNQPGKKASSRVVESEEEFNFGSWGGSVSTESEMCAADDVFFKGQILPLRLSVSSDSGLTKFQHDSRKPGGCLFRSESMDRGGSSGSISLGGLTSVNSSRSSSTRSHYSSSSNSSSNATTTTNNTTRNSKPRIRNQFHTYPSPKPQIRVSNARLGRNSSGGRCQIRSSKWDLFRLGLVRAPGIELQDLKLRNNNNITNRSSVSRNSSSGSSSNSTSSSVKNKQESEMGKQLQNKNKKQSFLDKNLGLFSGCKCSISAVEMVPLNNIVIIKSETDDSSSSKNIINESNAVHATEKKLQELKMKKKMKEKQQGKQAMSRHRTFEWLKELSHASYVDGNLVVD